jgi:FKBP-type peptidyl-prolyl cis-trans isomerase SlyD
MGLIAQNNFVRLAYRLRLPSGEWLRGTAELPEELAFVAGCGELLPGLERRLWGLRLQDAVEFTVPAAEAFGAYDPECVQVLSRKRFPPDMDIQPSQKVLPAGLPFDPEYPLTIKEVQGDQVILDLNHPLAGQDLHYSVKVVEVRPASPEELEPLKQCQSCREEMECGT